MEAWLTLHSYYLEAKGQKVQQNACKSGCDCICLVIYLSYFLILVLDRVQLSVWLWIGMWFSTLLRCHSCKYHPQTMNAAWGGFKLTNNKEKNILQCISHCFSCWAPKFPLLAKRRKKENCFGVSALTEIRTWQIAVFVLRKYNLRIENETAWFRSQWNRWEWHLWSRKESYLYRK